MDASRDDGNAFRHQAFGTAPSRHMQERLRRLSVRCNEATIARTNRYRMLYIALLGMALVALILFRGLMNMMKGGSASKSQELMRMRVTAQAIVVLILVAVVYFARPD